MLVQLGNVQRFSLIDSKGLRRIEWTLWGMAISLLFHCSNASCFTSCSRLKRRDSARVRTNRRHVIEPQLS
jgi:hypothetical protein